MSRSIIVIFRRWRSGNRSIIALFPDDIVDDRGSCNSYEHNGQHGPADYASVLTATLPVASEDAECQALIKELENQGYELDIRTRRPAMWRKS